MGREIRRVPEGWEHPKYTEEDQRFGEPSRTGYKPLYDESFTKAMREWILAWEAWERGERPDYFDPADYPNGIAFWQWHGGPPRSEYYRPEWTEAECTHFQMYETVSEGTPLTPPLPSLEALAEWLSTNADYYGHGPLTRAQADAFCRSGWTPSFVFTPATGLRPGIEAVADLEPRP